MHREPRPRHADVKLRFIGLTERIDRYAHDHLVDRLAWLAWLVTTKPWSMCRAPRGIISPFSTMSLPSPIPAQRAPRCCGISFLGSRSSSLFGSGHQPTRELIRS